MITIFAEKPDMARRIAASVGECKLDNGTIVTLSNLPRYEAALKSIQFKNGYIPIKFDNQQCVVTHGIGHLCTLFDLVDYDEDYKQWKNIDLPYIPKYYNIKVIPTTAKQFKVVKELFNKSNLIINATDADREGEVIFAYVYEKAKCKVPYKRAYYNSTTEEEFERAFSDLKDSSEAQNGESAGRCRGIADWLIGINCTVAATLSSNSSSVLSIGRVQTPTLAMLVEREKAIKNFVSKTYYVPSAVFKTLTGEEYKGECNTKCDTKEEAEDILRNLTGKAQVTSVERKVENVPSPSLYSLSLLQMDANKKFGFTADETLNITQSLYEKGHVTYPRTNSAFLPEDYKASADKALIALSLLDEYAPFLIGKPKKYNEKYFDNSKVESHFAIVPTNSTPEMNKLSDNERKIYDLICRSLIMTIYPSAKVEKVKVMTSDSGLSFKTTGSSVIEKGWMVVSDSSKDKYIPNLNEGDRVFGTYEAAEKKTEPPKRFTEASLLAAMLAADSNADDADYSSLAELGVKGIGTEATRASIIETLLKRGYIERSKKTVVPTEKGIALIDSLPLEDIKSAKLTAMWETRLHNIEKGKESAKEFVKDIESLTDEWVRKINSGMKVSFRSAESSTSASASDLKCPLCGGIVRDVSWGYGCSNYKTGCKFAVGKTIAEKKLTNKQIETLIKKGSTSEIKGFKSKKTGKTFSAKLVLSEDGKVNFKFD